MPHRETWVILPTQVNTQDDDADNDHEPHGCLGSYGIGLNKCGICQCATKASLPAVLSIIALAATAVIVGGTVRQRK